LFDLGENKLILGSASPRRKALLEQMGLIFEQRTVDLDETPKKGLSAAMVSEDLAVQKAQAFSLNENEIILCADTVVALDNELLAKPVHRAEAVHMLSKLSGRTHEVITGICIRSRQHQVCDHAITRVHFKELRTEEIDYYVDRFSPFDKAGSYGIQEWIGMIGVDRIEGDFYNVVGLPCRLVYDLLQNFVAYS
jgi:septum formation protein